MAKDATFQPAVGLPPLLPEPLNNYASISERMDLMAHPSVADALRAWWDRLPKDEKGCVAGPVQRVVYARLHRLLVPFGTAQDARAAAAEDFEYEARGKTSLDRDHFYAAAFDLVDMWCDTNTATEYLALLQAVLAVVEALLPALPVLALEYLLGREAYLDECLPRITPAPGVTKFQNRNRNVNPFSASKDEPVRQTNASTGVPLPPPLEARKVRHLHYQLLPFSNRQMYKEECMRLNCKPNSVLVASLSDVPEERDLARLVLRGNHVGCVLTLLDVVAENPALAVLSLAGAGVRNAGMEVFLQCLADHPGLAALDLSDNELLGCDVERPLRDLLRRNARLQHLRLYGTSLPLPAIRQLTAQSHRNFFRLNISREEHRAYEEAFFALSGGEGGAVSLPMVLSDWQPAYVPAHPKLSQPLYQRTVMNVQERVRARTNCLKASLAGRIETVTFHQLVTMMYPDLLPQEVEQRLSQLEEEAYSPCEPRLPDLVGVYDRHDPEGVGCVTLGDLEQALAGVPWGPALGQVCLALGFDARTAVWFDELEALLTRL
eukprot:EG_transcript_7157